MSTKRMAAMVAVVGFAAAANAQRNAIDIKVRLAGDTEWLDTLNYVNAVDDADVHVEVAMFYERATGYGFASSTHSIVMTPWVSVWGDAPMLLDRPDSSQHPDGRQGRFNRQAQRQAAYTTLGDHGRLRIAAANNTQNATGGGISPRQDTPGNSGTLFDTSNPAFGFRFDVILGFREDSAVTTYELSTPAERIANFGIYMTDTSNSQTNQMLTTVVLDGATITTRWLVPGPGSLMILGFFGACGGARRRR